MKINIVATHRFHLLDLARELQNLGHDVNFYSYVPKKRVITFGLNKKNIQSFYLLALPFLILQKIFKNSFIITASKNLLLDTYISLFMRDCDVFIGLGTVYKKSFIQAKRKYKAITIMEWGSKHIEEQQRILTQIPSVKAQNNYFTKRSIEGYHLVDYIAIASDHVKQSFISKGVRESKLLQNPYGVDLTMFKATQVESNPYDIILVGGWSYRKGCDLLIEVCKEKKYKLLHVGPIIDVSFPKNENMRHIDPVNQKELINYYKKAKVFVLPSREEGLAMVQPQALICGLPIVCSKDTGGRDLRQFLEKDKQNWIIEMESFTKQDLIDCIEQGLELANTQKYLRSYSEGVAEELSWASYGKRYNVYLNKIIK